MDRHSQSWMGWILAAAASFNIVAAAVLVLAPRAAGAMVGLNSLRYPELVQALGLLLGSFGLAYAIAAYKPLAHWPIVLSGLTAKIVTPIGFAHVAASGRIPWSAGWTVLLIDVLWWVPFGLILRHVWQTRLHSRREAVPEVLPVALRVATDSGITLAQLSSKCPVLLVFLRHAGCIFCREALADLASQRKQIEDTGTAIVLVHMGEPDSSRRFFGKYGLDDLPQISDPRCLLYRAFGLAKGSLRALFGPFVMWRGFQAVVAGGHAVGRLAGDGFQMPGLFLLYHGQVIATYRHQSAADRPDYLHLVQWEPLSRMSP